MIELLKMQREFDMLGMDSWVLRQVLMEKAIDNSADYCGNDANGLRMTVSVLENKVVEVKSKQLHKEMLAMQKNSPVWKVVQSASYHEDEDGIPEYKLHFSSNRNKDNKDSKRRRTKRKEK